MSEYEAAVEEVRRVSEANEAEAVLGADDLRVLQTIGFHPGRSGLTLRSVGLKAEDGSVLLRLEDQGYATYRNHGWYLTAAGDAYVMEHSK